jgi:hypothetical protein
VPLSGARAKARIGSLTISGPGRLRRGKAYALKARVTNSGDVTAKGSRLIVSGRGLGASVPAGSIPAKAAKTVRVRLKPKKTGRLKAAFKVTSNNAGGRTVRKNLVVTR